MSERPGPEAEAFSLNFRLVIVKIGAVSGVLQIGVVQSGVPQSGVVQSGVLQSGVLQSAAPSIAQWE